MFQRIFGGLCVLLFLSGCTKTTKEASATQSTNSYPLAIKVRNITKRTLYAACFSYMKKENAARWYWHKTDVYELIPNRDVTMTLGLFPSKFKLPDAFGILGVFLNYHDAENATYELMPDDNKLDLDRLLKLEGKTVVIGVEKYGIAGDAFDYGFIPDGQNMKDVPALDFSVENGTGKPLYVTAFVYEKKADMPIWEYEKSPVVYIEPNQKGLIEVDKILNAYDRKNIYGYLGVFDGSEKKDAENATYQLLKDNQIVDLGLLSVIREKNIMLKAQKYGIMGDVIEFVTKEPRKISFSKRENIKYQPRYS